MSYTAFTRIRTCALAIAAVLFVGSQASAQPQGGPNVTVVNTPLPVTVTNQAMPGTPVAFTLGDTISPPTPTFTVPTGQRLVIEYVSAVCGATAPGVFPGVLLTAVTNGVANQFVLATPFTPPNASLWAFGHLVKIYADSGTQVQVGSSRCTSLAVAFSGLLVNTP
jgi:hypothetical protein